MSGRKLLGYVVALALALSFGSPAFAASSIAIELDVVADGLISPVTLTHAGDGSGRLFVVEQTGQIRIVSNGLLLPQPFLDISDKLPTLGTLFDERGLLGLAFHPDYISNGRFFVRYSTPRQGDPEEPCNDPEGFVVGCHREVLAEYAVSPGDPDVADSGSEIILFTVDEPQFNHDAGAVEFGPDGYLYFSLGDGGGANDGLADVPPSHGPTGHGQNTSTALGTVLRIDVDSGSPYAIPPGNPFADGADGLPEIFAYGFRNPYRFSFDDGPGGDGALYLGDVGQAVFEEVDIVVNGGNYGWVIREGAHCFDPFNSGDPPTTCSTTGPFGEPLIDPVSEYTHAEGGISVIGGYVYRGSQAPLLVGKYVFADFSATFFPGGGRVYYFDISGPDAFARREFFLAPDGDPLGQYVKGLGEDQEGEVYLLASDTLGPNGDTGIVYRIVQVPVGGCCGDVFCSVVTEAECIATAGAYLGDGSRCRGDRDDNGINDACEVVVLPAVSEWGMLVLILMLVCIMTIKFDFLRRVRTCCSI